MLDSDRRNKRFLYGMTFASFVFTAIVWIIIIALRNRIRLAVAIFEEASSALRTLPQVSQPVFYSSYPLAHGSVVNSCS